MAIIENKNDEYKFCLVPNNWKEMLSHFRFLLSWRTIDCQMERTVTLVSIPTKNVFELLVSKQNRIMLPSQSMGTVID